MRYFHALTVLALLTTSVTLSVSLAQTGAPTSPHQATAQEIQGKINTLRQQPDEIRGQVTRQIALDIRDLPPSAMKVSLASSLANLATEGDFGREPLQAVATTLAQALEETPMKNGPYLELASLARYEHVVVSLESPPYTAALAELEAMDKRRAAAQFTLTDLHGKEWSLQNLRGKVVLVNFWATWCPPCRKEMPDLEALYERFGKDGLVVLSISDEDTAKVQAFIDEKGYKYPVLLDPGRKVNTIFAVQGIPKSFVFDREGKLVAQAIDMRTRKQFLEMLSTAGLK